MHILKSIFVYVSIQACAYVIDMGFFLVFVHSMTIDSIWANVSSKLISACFSFTAHRNLTFSGADRNAKFSQALKYFLLLGLNVPLSTLILSVLMKWIELPAMAKFVADVLCVGISFLQTKYLVFSKRR